MSDGGPVKLRMLGGGLAELRASSGGPVECRASSGGPAKCMASGGGPAECRASGGGLAECRASCGGSTELRASGGGPAECRASYGGPAECRASGDDPTECRASGDDLTECRASGGGPAECMASDGGPVECRASSGGPVECRASGDLPAECSASGGGPTECRAQVVVRRSAGPQDLAQILSRSGLNLAFVKWTEQVAKEIWEEEKIKALFQVECIRRREPVVLIVKSCLQLEGQNRPPPLPGETQSGDMEDLPPSILVEILSRLGDSNDLARCRLASRTLRFLSADVRSISIVCSRERFLRARAPATRELTIPFRSLVFNLLSFLSRSDGGCALRSLSLSVEEPDAASAEEEEGEDGGFDDGDDLHLTAADFLSQWLPSVASGLTSLSIGDYWCQACWRPSTAFQLISEQCDFITLIVLCFFFSLDFVYVAADTGQIRLVN
ncbi:hypothetical protein IEQ34_022549 [Dendrobium chrysotoxum]|uniref:F-box domain-containing protein n=1 Tax=Dendrobium chrysotoxum TaxID=161865 RepID=A0AAV7FY31_DENCH|nr:hypothetical protein IEQ34_022549 [Dendrobium chrysotoxum]